jgi:biopolymer transport protein ExbD
MRRVSVYERRGEGNEIPMTPLIDVVFQLLVFFLWTSSFQIIEQTLPSGVSDLSGSAPAEITEPPPPEEDFDEVIVRILYQQGRVRWLVNDQDAASLREVRGRLGDIAAIQRDVPVIVHPDLDTPLGVVINVYDLARLVGFEKVAMTVENE